MHEDFIFFFLFVLYFCHMSCGRKVQFRAQLSGAWEGKGGEPRRCFPRDSRPGRGAGDQESGECGLSNRESVTGGCWSRLRAPCQDCELRDLDRRHHDPHRPPRQGPPTVSCLVFLSFFRHPPPFMPIVTTSWLQLTLWLGQIFAKILQSYGISDSISHWEPRDLATLVKWCMTKTCNSTKKELDWLSCCLLTPEAELRNYFEPQNLSWWGIHYIVYSAQMGLQWGCGLPSLHCFLPSPVATPIPQFTWHLTLFTWPDASSIGYKIVPSRKFLCRETPFPDLMGYGHFWWLFTLSINLYFFSKVGVLAQMISSNAA